MKKLKAVEATRRDYHKDATLNSVHRSSLLVPELQHASVEINFLNHFLIKRGYPKIACRVTAVDIDGQRIESRLVEIDSPKVYSLPLRELLSANNAEDANGYLVEFFAAENLFIPFPAVMVNHHTPGCYNSVHSYNRTLNDPFEDDEINRNGIVECSINVRLDKQTDTSVVFSTGPAAVDDAIEINFTPRGGDTHYATLPVRMPRLTHQEISLRAIFPDIGNVSGGVLRVTQPQQRMFFGRMLAGARRSDGAFSGNHSYYDSSHRPEYWGNNNEAVRYYPYLQKFRQGLTVYPIHSPGRLILSLTFFDQHGSIAGTANLGEVESPSSVFAEIDVDREAASLGIDQQDLSGFALRATPVEGNTPSRIGHQIVFGDAKNSDALEASIQMSLTNSNVFVRDDKRGMCWGQSIVGENFESSLGICTNRPDGSPFEIGATFYGNQGEIAQRHWELEPGMSLDVDIKSELARELGKIIAGPPQQVWYVLSSTRPDIFAYSVCRNTITGHCSGEHAF